MFFLSPNSSQILPPNFKFSLAVSNQNQNKTIIFFHLTIYLLSGLSPPPPHTHTPQDSIFLPEVVNSGNFQRDKIYLNTNIKHMEISPGPPPDPHQKCPLLSASVCQLADISG